MHELSLAFDLIDRIEEIAASEDVASVDKVYVTIGDLSGIDADSFSYAFPEAARDSKARLAELIINKTQDNRFEFNRMEVTDV